MNSRAAHLFGAFILALGLLAPGIRTPFIKDAEPQSAEWIVDIVQHRHWLLPVDYYGFVDRKPPLYYWLSATIAELTGDRVDKVRARLVSLIAGAATAIVVLAWSSLRINAATGWIAFFFLIGSYGFASRATTALTDMLMTALLFGTYCLLYPAMEQPISAKRMVAAGTLLGLAVLTKGPVTVVLLGFATAIYLLLEHRNPLAFVKSSWSWAVLSVAAIIAISWYLPAFVEGRRHDLSGVFLSENFGHFMPASLGGTGEAARPIYYIAVRMFSAMLPLTLLLPALAMALWVGDFEGRSRNPILYQLAMVLAILIFFSAASAKRDDYILPALPSLAILFASLFGGPEPNHETSKLFRWSRNSITAAIAMVVGACVLAPMMIGGIGSQGFTTRLQSSDASYATILMRGLLDREWPFVCLGAVLLAGCALVTIGLWHSQNIRTGAGLAVIAVAGCLLWNGFLRPREAALRSLGSFVVEVHRGVGSAKIFVAYFDPEFSWYYGSGVPPLPRGVARDGVSDGRTIYLVARERELQRLSLAVKRRLRPVITAKVLGGGGPPTLYVLPAAGSPDLNQAAEAAK
jgi:4-amino-4-deoxy-L-arabinose transferase-like glycosyltransferase